MALCHAVDPDTLRMVRIGPLEVSRRQCTDKELNRFRPDFMPYATTDGARRTDG